MRILLLTGLAALSTIGGCWLALRARKHIHLLLGFGAGVLLGATFFDLLPEAIEAAGPRGWTSHGVLAPSSHAASAWSLPSGVSCMTSPTD